MIHHLLTAFLFLGTTLAAPGDYNATSDSDQIVCVYPLSGQYGFLVRLLYYILLIFAVFFHHHVWLVAGALASALTFSGSAAIHGFILAIVSNSSLYDIDVAGVWTVVSAATIAVDPVRDLSTFFRESQFRPIFGLWGVLVGIGSICAAVSLLRHY